MLNTIIKKLTSQTNTFKREKILQKIRLSVDQELIHYGLKIPLFYNIKCYFKKIEDQK